MVDVLLDSNNNVRINEELNLFIEKVNLYLSQNKYSLYINEIDKFIDNVILKKGLSKDHTLVFIKLIYPVCPFISEEIFKQVFNSKYSIINEEWPKKIRM